MCVIFECLTERGADYEFRLSAKNLVDYGEMSVEALRSPDGSKCRSIVPVDPPASRLVRGLLVVR